MAKLSKQYYYSRIGEKKVNCYHLIISKSILQKANINDDDELVLKAVDNKIVIEKRV